MQTFAIIVIYNGMRQNWIEKCFSSILASSSKVQIIAVDNNSNDDSVKFIKENFPEVKLIESKENLGFGQANNLGIKEALKKDADYVFLLNQDAWVEKDTIEKLLEIARKNTEFGIISPMHLNGKGDALDYNFSTQISPQSCENLYSDFVLNKVENKIYESNFICAAAWLVSAECLRKVGGFSPTFFHYAEDDNYIHRLIFKGLKIGVYPFSKIYHDREGRKLDKTKEESDKNLRNKLLLKYSNPQNQLSLNQRLKQLKFKINKNKLIGQNKWNSELKFEYDFLKTHQAQIDMNLVKSISEEEYIFIND